jgi:hypothetical protein
MGERRRKVEEKGIEDKKEPEKKAPVDQSLSGNVIVVQEHGTEVLLIKSDLSTERFPNSIKESRYSRSFIENQRRLEQSQNNVTLDHLLKSSIDLDDTAKKKIEQIRAIGSKRFANDLIELLESASKAIEQNANLLRILRHHLGLGSHSQMDSAGNDQKKTK